MILPEKKEGVKLINPRTLLLYGHPKIGKTSFATELECNLIADLETGSEYVDAYKIEINSLDELMELGAELNKEENKGRYKYLTIDTITKLEEWTEWYATKRYMESSQGSAYNRKGGVLLPRHKWENVVTMGQGYGYKWAREAMDIVLDKIESFGLPVIYMGHVRDKIVSKDGVDIVAKELDLTGKLSTKVMARVSAIGYMHRDENDDLMISFKSAELAGGTRIKRLAGKIIPADWSLIYI